MSHKLVYKLISYLAVVLIFYFLVKRLIFDWLGVSHYHFSFNYPYLIISFVLLVFSLSLLPLAWRLILKSFDKSCSMTSLQALKIYLTSEFGKYIPGKVWAVAGKIYLASQSGVSSQVLLASSLLDAVLAVTSTLVVGLIFFIFYIDILAAQIYLITLLIIVVVAVFIHPKVFYPLLNFLLTKFKRPVISQEFKLSYLKILKFASVYLLLALVSGLAFLFFVFSISQVDLLHWPLVVASFNLAKGLGVAAIFAPSGLGIREGILTLSLSSVFPSAIAVLISFLARLWATLAELIALALALILNKIYQAKQN